MSGNMEEGQTMPNGYRKANDSIVFEQFDDDLVILNMEIGQYFGVNPTGAEAWRQLLAGVAIQDIHCPSSPDGLSGFFDQLVTHGLVAPIEVPTSGASCSLDSAPTIEAFDDLSDLLMADPIHDVDTEVGWPKMPESQ